MVAMWVTPTHTVDPEDYFLWDNVTYPAVQGTFVDGGLVFSGLGHISNYLGVLQSIRFGNFEDEPDPQPRVFQITVQDTNGLYSQTETVEIEFLLFDDHSPVIATLPEYLFVEDTTDEVVFGTSIEVTDRDTGYFPQLNLTVELRDTVNPGELLTALPSSNVSVVWDATLSVLTLTGPALVAEMNAVLQTLRYVNTAEEPMNVTRTLVLTATDSLHRFSTTTYIRVQIVNDKPEIDVAGVLEVTFTERGTGVAVFPAVELTDSDHDTLNFARITLVDARDADDELLLPPDAAVLGADIALANRTNGMLEFLGTATKARYMEVLRLVLYAHTDAWTGNPTPGLRSVMLSVNDGEQFSDAATVSVSVVPVNDAPILEDGGAVYQTTFVEEGTPVQVSFPSLAVVDVDSPLLSGAVVAIAQAFDGPSERLNVTAATANVRLLSVHETCVLLCQQNETLNGSIEEIDPSFTGSPFTWCTSLCARIEAAASEADLICEATCASTTVTPLLIVSSRNPKEEKKIIQKKKNKTTTS